MQARYWGEAGRILSEDDDQVVVEFPDGDQYRFPRDIIGLELPPACHTYNGISVTRRCLICGRAMRRRARAKTCSPKCRKALSRRGGQ